MFLFFLLQNTTLTIKQTTIKNQMLDVLITNLVNIGITTKHMTIDILLMFDPNWIHAFNGHKNEELKKKF
jgi:hypothetical protein